MNSLSPNDFEFSFLQILEASLMSDNGSTSQYILIHELVRYNTPRVSFLIVLCGDG